MLNFAEHITKHDFSQKEWLVIGKGPSYSKIQNVDLGQYYTVSLNHVIKEIPVDFAHAIDIDVVFDCLEDIYNNAQFLITPLYPHVNNTPTSKQISDFFGAYPTLEQLDNEGRLLFYNSSSAQKKDSNYPTIPVKFFSADAVISLLAYSGFKKIRTVGIDGGSSYSGHFSKLNQKTLLSNGRPSFDIQFQAIANTIMNTGAIVLPIDMDEPIKIYVGSQKEQMIAVKVLEYSIKKHASCSVEVFPLHMANILIPAPQRPENRPRTPFSFQRFLIPQLCNYRGKAIYLDSDMQVFGNIYNLWNRKFEDSNVMSAWIDKDSGRIPQFSVMLLNCQSLEWDIHNIIHRLDENHYSYEELMYSMCVAKVATLIEPAWNSLEHYEEGITELIHYTDMQNQPWLKAGNKNNNLWIEELKEALKRNFISIDNLVKSIVNQEIRPSLYFEIRHNFLKNNKILHIIDIGFIPPHKQDISKYKKRTLHNAIQFFVINYIKWRTKVK